MSVPKGIQTRAAALHEVRSSTDRAKHRGMSSSDHFTAKLTLANDRHTRVLAVRTHIARLHTKLKKTTKTNGGTSTRERTAYDC